LTSNNNGKKYTVLAVDDEENNLALVRRTLHSNYNVICASSAKEALNIIEEKGNDISLIVSDQKMPEMEGTEFLKQVAQQYPDIVNILLTGHSNVDILIDAINECHLFQYIMKPFDPSDLRITIENGIKKYELTAERTKIADDLGDLFYKTIRSIAQALDAKDKYTHGHSFRVTLYSLAIAKQYGLEECELENVEIAGLLHDIGKIAIPENILCKPGKLTNEEFSAIKMHPQLGTKLVENIKQLNSISSWIKAHHEKYDGTGYPDGLTGEEIPLNARIIAIADTYDAMTSDRSYRKGLSHEIALEEIKRCSGTQFDPNLVQLFESIEPEILEIKSNPEEAYIKYSRIYRKEKKC